MLDSDFDELLEEYIEGTISDKDFIALVQHASTSVKCKKKFDEAEKMLEMTSGKLTDKSKRRFKAKYREFLEEIKSTMRRKQSSGKLLTHGYIYFIVFLFLVFLGIYPYIYMKKVTFGLMIAFFQIISAVGLISLSIYVFFFRGKD